MVLCLAGHNVFLKLTNHSTKPNFSDATMGNHGRNRLQEIQVKRASKQKKTLVDVEKDNKGATTTT